MAAASSSAWYWGSDRRRACRDGRACRPRSSLRRCRASRGRAFPPAPPAGRGRLRNCSSVRRPAAGRRRARLRDPQDHPRDRGADPGPGDPVLRRAGPTAAAVAAGAVLVRTVVMDDALSLLFLVAAATLRVATPLDPVRHGRAVLGAQRHHRCRPRRQDADGRLLRRRRRRDDGLGVVGIAAAIAAAEVLALLHGLACITYRGNQVVSGVAINIIAAGLHRGVGHGLVRARGADAGAGGRRAPAAAVLPGAPVQTTSWSMPALLAVLAHLVGRDAHALRPAPARRRRECRWRSTPPASR